MLREAEDSERERGCHSPFRCRGGLATYASDGVERAKKAPGHRVLDIHNIMEGFAHRLYVFDVGGK